VHSPGRIACGAAIDGLYAVGNTMAVPIGTSMLFSHLAVEDMLGRNV
jgi:3-oxosteroid 1-dehydrogenase